MIEDRKIKDNMLVGTKEGYENKGEALHGWK